MLPRPLTLLVACAAVLFVAHAAHAQADLKAIVLKHLTTSRDFTLKVAEQMPDADYGFKLTPPQMSFAEQMAHLASDQGALLSPFTTGKPAPSKPASMSKKDVIAYVRQSFDQSIALVSKLTPAQIETTKQLAQTLHNTTKPLYQQIEPLEDQLHSQLDAASPDACAVGNTVVQIAGLRDQIRDARKDFDEAFSAILTPEQLAKYEALKDAARIGEEEGE